jgi:hypothetical protein
MESSWDIDRLGVFTGSQIHRLLATKRDGSGFGEKAMEYIHEVVAELLTGQPKPQSTSWAMEWGNTHEEQAMIAYKNKTGYKVTYYGKENPKFFKMEAYMCGASPDGVTSKRVVEIKCPYNTANHVENAQLTADAFPKERKEYYAQLQLEMLVMGREKADFVSFDPRILCTERQLVILEIPFSKDFGDSMLKKVSDASELVKNLYKELK